MHIGKVGISEEINNSRNILCPFCHAEGKISRIDENDDGGKQEFLCEENSGCPELLSNAGLNSLPVFYRGNFPIMLQSFAHPKRPLHRTELRTCSEDWILTMPSAAQPASLPNPQYGIMANDRQLLMPPQPLRHESEGEHNKSASSSK